MKCKKYLKTEEVILEVIMEKKRYTVNVMGVKEINYTRWE